MTKCYGEFIGHNIVGKFMLYLLNNHLQQKYGAILHNNFIKTELIYKQVCGSKVLLELLSLQFK